MANKPTSRGDAIGTGTTEHNDLARSGSEKRTQKTAAPNPGMRHIAIGPDQKRYHARGVSPTQAKRMLGTDTVGEVNSGGIPKPGATSGENVPVHSHMTKAQKVAHDPRLGPQVLKEAVLSGSHVSSADYPPKK